MQATTTIPVNVTYVHNFITSLVFTMLVETVTLVVAIYLLKRFKVIKLVSALKDQIFAGLLASFATIPYVWYIVPNLLYMQMNRNASLSYSEPFIFAVEVVIYRFVLRLPWQWCIGISLLANVASYYLGPLLRALGLWIYW
jgi:hypothetical protein